MRRFLGFFGAALLVSTAGAQKPDYFPLKPGLKKYFQATINQSTNIGGKSAGSQTAQSTIEEEIVGPSKALGKETILVRSSRKDSSSGGPLGNVNSSYQTESFYRVGAEGVFLLANFRAASDATQKAETTRFEPPLRLLKLPADSGSSWKVGTMTMQGLSVKPEARIQGREEVSVPAGSFKNCLKIKSGSSDLGGTIDMGGTPLTVTGGEFTATSWYAPGVGMVKEEVYTRFALSSPQMPGMTAEVTFEQKRLLTKVEGTGAGKDTKKAPDKK